MILAIFTMILSLTPVDVNLLIQFRFALLVDIVKTVNCLNFVGRAHHNRHVTVACTGVFEVWQWFGDFVSAAVVFE
jgi:hypothetical protein